MDDKKAVLGSVLL